MHGQVELNDLETDVYLINSDRYHNIKQIIQDLCSDIFLALPFFYTFAGCYTISSFYGKGRCKPYDVWVKSKGKDDFIDVFVEFGEKRANVTSDDIGILESLVLQLSRSRYNVLDAPRLEKFKMSTDNDLRVLPPSKEALRQHIYRVSYQGGYLWR